ncbi:MAG TPA: hypothetical protein DEP99_04630 [Nitrospiraceae bacterium]|nr:hypothetical protein [Nitrospiraceae bacterium]
MKKDILKIYFRGADDKDLKAFIERFLTSGLLWIYIATNPKKRWRLFYEKLLEDKKSLFRDEYNKAFLFCKTYKELSRLFIGKEIQLKNLFLPKEAETWPEKFVRYKREDELRWKEILELIA